MRGERKNNYLHLGQQHNKDTSTEGRVEVMKED